MRVLVALGGNALLQRDEPMTMATQQRNIELAVAALLPLLQRHELVITHGNGPQVGLLALRSGESEPLDVLDAETEGMIGYLIEQELDNQLQGSRPLATLLTRIEVDSRDPAFAAPAKPIGPRYSPTEAADLERRLGWTMVSDGDRRRRAVASPEPRRVIEREVIAGLLASGVTVVCCGGGGIPVCRDEQERLRGVEAVIDKDLASALLASDLDCDALLLLSDVDAVYRDWRSAAAQAIGDVTVSQLRGLALEAGSMAPKAEAACRFVERSGRLAAIGRLQDASSLLEGQVGTQVRP